MGKTRVGVCAIYPCRLQRMHQDLEDTFSIDAVVLKINGKQQTVP